MGDAGGGVTRTAGTVRIWDIVLECAAGCIQEGVQVVQVKYACGVIEAGRGVDSNPIANICILLNHQTIPSGKAAKNAAHTLVCHLRTATPSPM